MPPAGVSEESVSEGINLRAPAIGSCEDDGFSRRRRPPLAREQHIERRCRRPSCPFLTSLTVVHPHKSKNRPKLPLYPRGWLSDDRRLQNPAIHGENVSHGFHAPRRSSAGLPNVEDVEGLESLLRHHFPPAPCSPSFPLVSEIHIRPGSSGTLQGVIIQDDEP